MVIHCRLFLLFETAMSKVGIFVHCRHLATDDWERLVWGYPAADELGDFATMARIILTLTPDDELASIVIGRGPSYKDGLDEAAYAIKYLADNIQRLRDFATLAPLIDALTDDEYANFCQKMLAITPTVEIANTRTELAAAAELLNKSGAEKVFQICAATHAPRCIKEQSVARRAGVISHNQQWYTVATDVSYKDSSPSEVFVAEPLHLSDQPMSQFKPALYQAIAPYYSLNDGDKRAFNRLVDDFMQAHK